ncbi:MAG: ATP synthase F1 subunit delta [Eubacterium sp.]|nr:ATP synthase F1 subunit delta [Eubacterium sp.]
MASVDKVYGDALFTLVTDEAKGSLGEIFEQLKGVRDIFADTPELIKLLKAPTVSDADKRAVIEEAFSGRVHEYLLNFLLVLTENGRADRLGSITEYFTALYNDYNGLADVEVVSAAALSDETVEKIKQKMEQVTGKKVTLQLKTDPSIIGGVMINCGGTRIDGSVRSRLEQLRGEIAGIIE